MKDTSRKSATIYLKQIRVLLPIHTKDEKKFLNDFNKAVYDYVSENQNCTYNDIVDRFEPPVDVVHNYISSMDQDQLCKKVSLNSAIKKAIAIIVIAMIGILGMRYYILYDLYQEAKDAIPTKEVTVIE